MNTVLMVLAMGSVSACSGQKAVFERVASADETKEAVVMVCASEADAKQRELVGAVFAKAGQGCGDVAQSLAHFTASLPLDVDAPGASVVWVGEQAVFDIEGEPVIKARSASGGAAVDLIQLKGGFEGADLPAEE